MGQCYFCKTEANQEHGKCQVFYYECPICGTYGVTESYRYSDNVYKQGIEPHKVASYLFYDRIINKKLRELSPVYIHPTDAGKIGDIENPRIITELDIENWYPKTFAEKIDRILLLLSLLSNFEGDTFLVEFDLLSSLFFLREQTKDFQTDPQLHFFREFLKDSALVNYDVYIDNNPRRAEPKKPGLRFKILPKGYERIYELQKNNINNKDVFIAMSFDKEYAGIRDKIIGAITEAGYKEKIMQTHQTNNWIMPEIFHLIRQSKFIIVDLTSHNLGAYYESGFAEGMGKHVIHICREDIFKSESHFDVKQKATLLWKNIDEIPKLLIDRIEATVGRAK